MATIDDILSNFQSLNLKDQVPVIVQKLSPEMVDYNLNQLEKGLTSEGISITPRYKSPLYAAYKQQIGSIAGFGVPNLKLSGDFYSGFYIQITGMSFDFGSRDSKSLLLEGEYSKNGGIFGLTDDNKGNFAQQDVKPELFDYIYSKTGLPRS